MFPFTTTNLHELPFQHAIEFPCLQGDSVDMLIQHAKCATQNMEEKFWEDDEKMVHQVCFFVLNMWFKDV